MTRRTSKNAFLMGSDKPNDSRDDRKQNYKIKYKNDFSIFLRHFPNIFRGDSWIWELIWGWRALKTRKMVVLSRQEELYGPPQHK